VVRVTLEWKVERFGKFGVQMWLQPWRMRNRLKKSRVRFASDALIHKYGFGMTVKSFKMLHLC
jgi:hypothetical protein